LVAEITDTVNKVNEKPYVAPVSSYRSNVIDGYFVLEKNEEELLISRINVIIGVMIAFLIVVMLGSYYVVSLKEIQFNKIRKSIIQNRDENVELQNKLDSLTSYSHVDQVTRQKNLVQHSQQILEVKASDTPIEKNVKKAHMPSFKWSIGY